MTTTTTRPELMALTAALLAGKTTQDFSIRSVHSLSGRRNRSLAALVSETIYDEPGNAIHPLLAYVGKRAAQGDVEALALVDRMAADLVEDDAAEPDEDLALEAQQAQMRDDARDRAAFARATGAADALRGVL